MFTAAYKYLLHYVLGVPFRLHICTSSNPHAYILQQKPFWLGLGFEASQ